VCVAKADFKFKITISEPLLVTSVSVYTDLSSFFFPTQMLQGQLNYWRNCKNLEKYPYTSYSP